MRTTLVFLSLSALCCNAQQPIFQETYDRIAHGWILLPREQFIRSNVEALSRSFLEKHSEASFVRFQVVTAQYQALPVPRSPMATFKSWSRAFQRLRQLDWSMAETISISGSAVMRFRASNGQVNRIILKGRDPLLVEMGQDRYEILHIHTSRGAGVVRIFVQAPIKPDQHRGEQILSMLADRLPFQTVVVSVRSDPWFIIETGYPDYEPFAHLGLDAPSEREYESSPTVHCLLRSGRIACGATGE